MEDCSQAPITSNEASSAISQLVNIETRADFIKALSTLSSLADNLNQQVDEIGKILEANAIESAKQRALEISNRHPFSPFNKVALTVSTADGLKYEIQESPLFHHPYDMMGATFDGVKAAHDRNPSDICI